MLDRFRTHLLAPALPYEHEQDSAKGRGVRAMSAALVALSLLEILVFAIGGVFSQVAAYLWFALGALAFAYLCWNYVVAVIADLRRGALWGLIPLVVGIPFCFWYVDSYSFLNTESLSELHDTYTQMKKPDLAYTSVFWTSYPSRSLTLNLIPTWLFGVSPWAYRVGFSFPILFGSLFFFTGMRRFHIKDRHASAIASLAATALFSYPMFCEISRLFEMAISSTSYGLWAIGAMFLFAARPTAASALTAAWTIGLLASSFTSGLALVALLLLLLGLWLARTLTRRDRDVTPLVAAVLLNSVVVSVAMYLIRARALRAKQIEFEQMITSFLQALDYTVSFSKPVFTPTELVIPTLLAALFAILLRGGLVPLILTAWCFPVIWSATNLHGKIGPQLPFALYRSLIIIPAILYVMSRCLTWALNPLYRKPWISRCCVLALIAALYWPLARTYSTQSILRPTRAPYGREAVAMEIVNALPGLGLTPYSDAWIANRVDEKTIENFLPCLQYFLLNWQRIHNSQPLPVSSTDPKKPGLIITLPGDSSIGQEFPGYRKQNSELSVTISQTQQVVLSIVSLQPQPD